MDFYRKNLRNSFGLPLRQTSQSQLDSFSGLQLQYLASSFAAAFQEQCLRQDLHLCLSPVHQTMYGWETMGHKGPYDPTYYLHHRDWN